MHAGTPGTHSDCQITTYIYSGLLITYDNKITLYDVTKIHIPKCCFQI